LECCRSVKAEPVDSLVVEPSHTQDVESQDEGSESDVSNEASEEEEEAESEQGSQKFWDAVEIVAESAKKGYLIRWAGTDENGQPWEDSWVSLSSISRTALTQALIDAAIQFGIAIRNRKTMRPPSWCRLGKTRKQGRNASHQRNSRGNR